MCRTNARNFFWKRTEDAVLDKEVEHDDPQQASNVTKCGPPSPLRVVSYNVLSSSLGCASYFTRCSPEDLESETRFDRIVKKLEEQMAQGAVICLQEVSRKWSGKLVPLFQRNGYMHASSLTGNKWNGYMGQVLAWPSARYAALDVECVSLPDTVTWPEPEQEAPKPGLAQLKTWLKPIPKPNSNSGLVQRLLEKRPVYDPWADAKRRQNGVVIATLKDIQTSKTFTVATYHMPCLFGSDEKCKVMTIHVGLLFQHAQHFAKGPLIIAGDFNIKPDSAQYSYIAHGMFLDTEHPQKPEWVSKEIQNPLQATMEPMRSAYAVHDREPEFTNLAWTKGCTSAFVDTLDYIWVSEHWAVTGVLPLPKKEFVAGVDSFPAFDQPSDHLMIHADLVLT